MAFKALLVACASALLVQSAFSQCAAGLAAPWGLAGPAAGWSGLAAPGLTGPGLAGAFGAGCGCGGVASTGGGLPVTSASPIPPVGVTVVSENAYEGVLSAGGNLPFLGTVAIEGVLPTAGAGGVSYGCGNGAVGIAAEEGPIITGILAPEVFAPAAALAAPGIAGFGLGGVAGYGLTGIDGYGLAGPAGYGLAGPAGYGLGGLGCGCGAIY